MPPFYEGSAFDPSADALSLVRRIEAEAVDEDMVAGMCMHAMHVLEQRLDVSRERLKEIQIKRTLDNRADLMRARAKGVKPADILLPGQQPDAPRVQLVPPGVIPDPYRTLTSK